MKRCIIFTGGRPEPHLPDGLELGGAYIIAADSGYKNCKQLGAVPNLAVGDYDSLNFVPDPCEKDDSDLMAAVREALRRGCGDITILGAMGGRFDHTFANMQVLAFINSEGARGRILSCGEEIMLAGAGEYSVARREGYSLSLFAYTPQVRGLTLRGVKYSLENGEISANFPIGISNEITAERAEISFTEGLLLIVQSRLE